MMILFKYFLGNLPPTPSWVSERPYLSRDYVSGPGISHSTTVSMQHIVVCFSVTVYYPSKCCLHNMLWVNLVCSSEWSQLRLTCVKQEGYVWYQYLIRQTNMSKFVMIDSMASGGEEGLQSQRSGVDVPIYLQGITKSRKECEGIKARIRIRLIWDLCRLGQDQEFRVGGVYVILFKNP